MEYTLDSTHYPASFIAKYTNSYGDDNNSAIVQDSNIVASILTTQDELRSALTGGSDLWDRFVAAGGDNGHSGFSYKTVLMVTWMRIVNGELPVGDSQLS